MDPADCLLSVEEVHRCGLFGAGGQQAVHCGATEGGDLDVLGVGDQQDGQTVYWHWKCIIDIPINKRNMRRTSLQPFVKLVDIQS